MFSENSYFNVAFFVYWIVPIVFRCKSPAGYWARCSHFAYKNMLCTKDMKIRIAIESTLSEDKSSPTKFQDRALLLARKTFCIFNFINVKVIPNRDSFAGKSLLRSLRGIAPKIINIRIGHWNRYTIPPASALISRNRVAPYNLYIHNFYKIYTFPHTFIAFKNISHFTR